MRADMLTSILSELNGSSADIEASAIVSTDGLMMAALLPAGMDEDRGQQGGHHQAVGGDDGGGLDVGRGAVQLGENRRQHVSAHGVFLA